MKADQLIRRIEIRDKRGNVIGTKDVVTYPGLLSKAHEEGLIRIRTHLIQKPSKENGRTAIAKAFVETKKGRFDGIGDASPENVNSFIVPHLIRVAETRAKARALRDAVNIGVVSFEELNGDGLSDDAATATNVPKNDSASRTRKPAPSPSPAKPTHTDLAPMTESQRRYLFRLMATAGFVAQAAELKLNEMLKVTSLIDATKVQAASLIDQLIRENTLKVADGKH
mgnify:CR=1 FL=1